MIPSRHADLRADDLRPLGRGHRLVEQVDPVEQVAELEAPEHLAQLRAVRRREHERGRIEVEVEVAPHRRELLRLERDVGVLEDVLLARRRQLVGVRDHLFDRAVLRDELPRGLVADAGDARDVVGRVALEADEVRAPGRAGCRSAPRRARACRRADPARRAASSSGRRSRSTSWNASRSVETTQVLIPASSARVASVAITSSASQPSNSRFSVAERLDDRPEVRELLAQQVGHLAAALLVDLRRRDAPRARSAACPTRRRPPSACSPSAA